MNIEKLTQALKQEHAWRIISEIRTMTVYTEEELEKEISKLRILNIEFKVTKLW